LGSAADLLKKEDLPFLFPPFADWKTVVEVVDAYE